MNVKLRLSECWLEENIASARRLFEHEERSFERENRNLSPILKDSEDKIAAQSDKSFQKT